MPKPTRAGALALTCGDPSGIGPEIAMAAWALRSARDVPAFYFLCDPDLISLRASRLGVELTIAKVDPSEAEATFAEALPVVPLKSAFVDAPGTPSTTNAPGIIEAIERAVDDVACGRAAALVTCPIAKKPLYDAGFKYPGHTEFLGELGSRIAGRTIVPVMMLAGPELRAVPVTIHIPLSAVPQALTTQSIIDVATIAAGDLVTRFGIAKPRLALSGLNPHAGEDGAMGTEDAAIILPAIEELRRRGYDARGPLPADTMFHAAARATYDVAICMYHDQALIPAKALAFDETVNVTLGLPFVRTSPDHGTAFDIAGKGIARPDSLIAALRMARAMADAEASAR